MFSYADIDLLSSSLVHTDMGSKTAKFLGLERAPWTPEQSAEKIMAIVSYHYFPVHCLKSKRH